MNNSQSSALQGTGVITGAARGIGLATAETLVSRGARVWMVDRDGEALENALPQHDDSDTSMVRRLCLDLSEERACEELLERVTGNEVRYLVNNAAPSLRDQEVGSSFFEGIRQSLGLTGHLCRLFAPELARSGNAAMVNVGSIAGLVATGSDWYSSAKQGVVGLTRELAVQLGPSGIRVNVILPGVIGTRRARRFFEDKEVEKQTIESIPLRRIGTPSEIGEIICFLLSDQSSYITGASIVADGGITISSGFA